MKVESPLKASGRAELIYFFSSSHIQSWDLKCTKMKCTKSFSMLRFKNLPLPNSGPTNSPSLISLIGIEVENSL